jgi:hypothetical protein
MATIQELKDELNVHRFSAFIGKTAIVGLYQFYKDEPVNRSQDFGLIHSFENGLMVLKTHDKKSYFPLKYEALVPAPRGKYILDATQEEIENPDYLISWRVDLEDDLEESQWRANTAPHFSSIVGKEWEFEYSHDRDYLFELIDSRGEELIGKTIIIGLREYRVREDGDSEFIRQSQVHGEIMRVDISEGVVIKLADGSDYKLPPDISMLQSAPPGEYKERSTGEVIVNPDLMTMYTTTKPWNSE